MTTGQKIKTKRETLNISQKELATKTNINVSVMNRIESGERAIRDDEILKIAKFLNVSTDYLLGNETPTLTEKDEKDIAKSMERLKDQLKNSQGLMFDGEPLDEETKSLLLEELERQERLVKTINKKYIPKKFRK